MVENKVVFKNQIVHCREAEFIRLRQEREDRINQRAAIRRQERETKRKLLFYIQSVEERMNKLREEEAAREREEAERRKKEEAKRKAKLNEIAERQRQREREIEEKERLARESLLRRSIEPPSRPVDSSIPVARPPEPVAAAAAAAAAVPSPVKYVPRFLREKTERKTSTPPPEPDRWSRTDNRPRLSGDRWSDDRTSSFSCSNPRSSSSSRSSTRGTWLSSHFACVLIIQ